MDTVSIRLIDLRVSEHHSYLSGSLCGSSVPDDKLSQYPRLKFRFPWPQLANVISLGWIPNEEANHEWFCLLSVSLCISVSRPSIRRRLQSNWKTPLLYKVIFLSVYESIVFLRLIWHVWQHHNHMPLNHTNPFTAAAAVKSAALPKHVDSPASHTVRIWHIKAARKWNRWSCRAPW